MRIHAYIIGWQIADTIRFTIQHYKALCERVVFYDNYSTDDTVKIAQECGAEIRYFGEPGVLNDQHYLDVKNHCWKESDADWVIVCDDDEIITSPSWHVKEGTIAKCEGYEMYDFGMPVRGFYEMQKGVPNGNYNKIAIWNPKEIREINYVFGCHVARPEGNIHWSPLTYKMLHYRSIGGPNRIINRHAAYRSKKISEINLKWGLGSHYWNQTDEQRRQHWLEEYDRRHYITSFWV